MKISWAADSADLGRRAAAEFDAALGPRERLVAALPSGRTPLGLYAELRARHAAGRLDASRLKLYALDEYEGLAADDPESFAAYFARELGVPLGLSQGQLRVPAGGAVPGRVDPATDIGAHEAAIAADGGLDLAIIGVGGNGHVAFNEPGSDWQAAGRVVELAPCTVEPLVPRFAGRAAPRRGVTLGLPVLRAARRVLLLADGEDKARALAALFSGTASRDWPVTAFADHPDLQVIATLRSRP